MRIIGINHQHAHFWKDNHSLTAYIWREIEEILNWMEKLNKWSEEGDLDDICRNLAKSKRSQKKNKGTFSAKDALKELRDWKITKPRKTKNKNKKHKNKKE